jgi:hypothetical protein
MTTVPPSTVHLSLLLNIMMQIMTANTTPPERRVLVNVLVKLVHLVLCIIEVVEQDPDGATSKERRHRQTNKHPLNRRVVQERVEGLSDGGSEGVGEQVHGLDEGLHAGWRLGVGILETGDGGEDLRETDEHVGSGLRGNVDVVSLVDTVDLVGLAERLAEAGSGLVDVVLDDGGVHHGEGSDPETSNDTVDGRERNLGLAERRHEPLVNDGQENDDGNGIEVLHQIVGNTVAAHLTGLGDEVVGEVVVDDPVDGVETEDLASNESTLDLVDEVVVPLGNSIVSNSRLVCGLRSVHLAVFDHDPDDAESVGDDGALGRADNVNLATENEDQETDEEDAQTHEVGSPEVDVALQVGGCEQGERSGVDAPVEDL